MRKATAGAALAEQLNYLRLQRTIGSALVRQSGGRKEVVFVVQHADHYKFLSLQRRHVARIFFFGTFSID